MWAVKPALVLLKPAHAHASADAAEDAEADGHADAGVGADSGAHSFRPNDKTFLPRTATGPCSGHLPDAPPCHALNTGVLPHTATGVHLARGGPAAAPGRTCCCCSSHGPGGIPGWQRPRVRCRAAVHPGPPRRRVWVRVCGRGHGRTRASKQRHGRAAGRAGHCVQGRDGPVLGHRLRGTGALGRVPLRGAA